MLTTITLGLVAGATIGTGQTEFSLAGLDDGSTVIVRIASQFNPDIDNTNLDFRLNFTTNPTTQGYGTTNFSITREQALICNEGADQNYISEILMNFYVGSSLSGPTTELEVLMFKQEQVMKVTLR